MSYLFEGAFDFCVKFKVQRGICTPIPPCLKPSERRPHTNDRRRSIGNFQKHWPTRYFFFFKWLFHSACGSSAGRGAALEDVAAYFFYHLWWALRSGVLSLIQFVPALHQLNNDGPAEVHQLETRHVGPAMHEPLQRYVLKTLKAGTERRRDDVRMQVEEKDKPPWQSLRNLSQLRTVYLIIYTRI